ncbi:MULTISPECIES: hypothetical protein [unclassified Modestobacter]|uniref:hypothetical protein n=1 Tax=unclassified Modestobacter TaxID=2643866 RepID=UPI0022AAADF1|nr:MULTISPECIES: hypothetical protein [unclassified Modestobacter]MCZ2824868.1 hypothetical protein [Modestobacter sp. VKM Ac-2981]MCZ2854629.1 hypothetical protein [Modestobacter sp. VKM Ac-2982]
MTAPDWDAVPYTGPPSYRTPPPQPGHGHPSQPGPPPGWGPPQEWAAPQGWPPPPGWGPAGWGPQAWGPPPWGPPGAWGGPRRPARPGAVVAAAVLAFVSAVLVVLGTIYGLAFSALVSLARGPSAGVGSWTALAQLALVALLVVGGLRQLNGDRRWLLAAGAVQVALCLYWVFVLDDLSSRTVGDVLGFVPLLYLALAGTAVGLTFLPDARAWARRADPPAPAPGPEQTPAGVHWPDA